MRDDAVANLTQLIGEAEELHTYSVRRLYSALAEDISQVSLLSPQVQLTSLLKFECFSPTCGAARSWPKTKPTFT